MSYDVLEYCTRAVIRHLNGDMDIFNTYKAMALQKYKSQNSITIGELISKEVKQELKKLVSWKGGKYEKTIQFRTYGRVFKM